MIALALVLSLALAEPPDGGTADAGARRGGRAGEERGAPDGGAPESGARDPDAEVIEHRALLEQLELLDRLDLFDGEAPARSKEPAPAR